MGKKTVYTLAHQNIKLPKFRVSPANLSTFNCITKLLLVKSCLSGGKMSRSVADCLSWLKTNSVGRMICLGRFPELIVINTIFNVRSVSTLLWRIYSHNQGTADFHNIPVVFYPTKSVCISEAVWFLVFKLHTYSRSRQEKNFLSSPMRLDASSAI